MLHEVGIAKISSLPRAHHFLELLVENFHGCCRVLLLPMSAHTKPQKKVLSTLRSLLRHVSANFDNRTGAVPVKDVKQWTGEIMAAYRANQSVKGREEVRQLRSAAVDMLAMLQSVHDQKVSDCCAAGLLSCPRRTSKVVIAELQALANRLRAPRRSFSSGTVASTRSLENTARQLPIAWVSPSQRRSRCANSTSQRTSGSDHAVCPCSNARDPMIWANTVVLYQHSANRMKK